MLIKYDFSRLIARISIFLSCAYLLSPSAAAQPAIFHASITAQPGEAVSIQGQFGAAAQAYLATGTATTGQQLPIVVQQAGHLMVQLPATLAADMYQVWVTDQGQRSASVYLNRAHGLHFDSPFITPGGSIRLFGRNLSLNSSTPQVRLVAQAGGSGNGTATVQAADPYSLTFTAPTSLVPGQTYSGYVSNGLGGTAGETLVEQTLTATRAGTDYFALGVGWAAKLDYYANRYNVRTDSRLPQHATGDGTTNDLPALQAAIDRAAADGGGVVFVPVGTYKMVLTATGGLTMRNRVAVQGAGKTATLLRFGYNTTTPGWTADGHWGMLWGNVTQAGIADLSLQNIDNSGAFYNNMYGQGTELFMQRVSFDLNRGSWLWLAGSSRFVISNSEFTQGVDDKAGYNGIVQLNECQDFVVSHNTFTFAVGGLSVNNTIRGILEDNVVNRDGSARWPTSLQLVNHVVSLNFAENVALLRNTFRVVNGPAQNINDGETIIAEGGGPSRIDEDAGTVSDATATTLRDNSKSWGTPQLHPVVAIVRGPGMGQWRSIASRTGNTLTLSQPWTVLPRAGSRYAIFNWGARNWILQGNTLEGNRRGITLYQNATTDVAIADNTLTNSGSIDISPWQADRSQSGVPQEFLPMYDTQITGNKVSDTDGSNGVFIGVHLIQVVQPSTFGTAAIGLEVRRNTLTAHRPNVPAVVDDNFPEGYLNDVRFQINNNQYYADEQTPALLGSIFQDNTAINCIAALYLNSGSYDTFVCNMRLTDSLNPLQDSKLDHVSHASVNTVTCAATPAGTGSIPPVADPHTNPTVAPNTRPVSLVALTGSDPNPQGSVIGFNLVSLPDTTQGVVYVRGTKAVANTWVPASQAQNLTFRPALNYTGRFLFQYTATNNQNISGAAAPFVVPVAATASPLPVELVRFSAVSQGSNALLTWQTASETNSDYFAVERSTDGVQFRALTSVPGKGTTTSASSYEYLDAAVPAQPLVYYRLRQVDRDGTASYSAVQTVAFGSATAELVRLYPNPVADELHVQLSRADARLQVYSATYALVLQDSSAQTEKVLDVSSLPAGTYLLSARWEDGTRDTRRFIKE